jgi:hypothetical protein
MSNVAYLCCSDLERTYPSFQNPAYEPDEHTLAVGVYCVPMLWLCAFRTVDLRTDTFEVGGTTITEPAPLTTRQDALGRLSESVPRLESALGLAAGALAEYGACVHELLTSAVGKYVTIELQEIAYLSKPDVFYADVARALRVLAGDEIAGAGDAVLLGSDFDVKRQIHAPRTFFTLNGLEEGDYRNFECLLGASHERAVPWERTSTTET